MRIIDVTQRTPAWYQWRAGGVTASEAPVLMSLSPWKTPWRLWAERTGLILPDDTTGNPLIRRGIEFEDRARQQAEHHFNTLLLPVCGMAARNPRFRASFDGLLDDGSPVELKCPHPSTWQQIQVLGEQHTIVQCYMMQVRFQLLVCDRPQGMLVFWCDDDILVFTVERCPLQERELIEQATAFWQQLMTLTPPEKCPKRDWFEPEQQAQDAWQQLINQYCMQDRSVQALQTALTAEKARLMELRDELVARMGDFSHARTDDIQVTRYLSRGAVDLDKLLTRLGITVDDDTLNACRKPVTERVRVQVSRNAEPETYVSESSDRLPPGLPVDSSDGSGWF